MSGLFPFLAPSLLPLPETASHGNPLSMDRRHQRRAVVIPAGRTPAGVRPSGSRCVRAACSSVCWARWCACWASRPAAAPGARGMSRRSRHSPCRWPAASARATWRASTRPIAVGRAGRRVLDVGHRPAGCVECLRRIDPRSTLQTQGAGLLYRRPGLLHGTRTGQTLDGRPLRRADLRDIRFRLQLGAEQHDLRGLGGCFRLRPPLGRRRPGAAHAAGHLRRHSPYRPGERGGRPGHGTGIYRPWRWASCSSISGGCPRSWS